MGILDDAIREHLDLKRHHGAQDDEVKRLEDEAFGPPTRPGEPDFPESQEQPAVEGANGVETATAEPPLAGEGLSEEATALLDREPDASAEAPTAGEQPQIETPPPLPETADEAPSPPEPPSEEQPAAEPQPPPAPAEHDEPEAAFFDQELETELSLDDLDLDDEEDQPGEAPAEPASDEHPAEPASEEHPTAGLETVEHPMEELVGDDAEAPATGEEEHLPEEHGEEGEDDDEDVLEETPEFLRDQPEDDELWFEQGEPKDFDF